MATNSLLCTCSHLFFFFNPQNPLKTLNSKFPQTISLCNFNASDPNNLFSRRGWAFSYLNSHLHHNPSRNSKRLNCVSSKTLFSATPKTRNYEFSDGAAEVELRLPLGGTEIQDIVINTDENSLSIKLKSFGSSTTLMETSHLYDKIKAAETIWYIDEDQLVVNLKKHNPELKWPDIMESWESLTTGVGQILKGISINIVGDSTEINQKVARELAVGLGYTPLNTSDLLEALVKQSIASWVMAEGVDSVVEAEASILESLSSYVRSVIATLGGEHGAAKRADKWRHLYAGFTIWLSQCQASGFSLSIPMDLVLVVGLGPVSDDANVKVEQMTLIHQQVRQCLADVNDEDSAKEEAWREIQDATGAYSNAEVVVKLGVWDPDLSQTAAQACLSALKKLILSDTKLPGKKNLYTRLGCRGDWPNIKPPGWDPATGSSGSSES